MKMQHNSHHRFAALSTAGLTLLTVTALLAGNLSYADEDVSKYIHKISRFISCNPTGSDNETIEQSIARLQKGADQRNAEDMNTLGMCHLNGTGVATNSAQAVYWFRKSAELGNRMAMCNLGMCYLNGTGVEQDHRQAVALFTVAARAEMTVAYFNLAQCYIHGYGVKQDTRRAVEWLHKAAAQGDDSSKYFLGRCYEHGIGTDKSTAMAIYWYRQLNPFCYPDVPGTIKRLIAAAQCEQAFAELPNTLKSVTDMQGFAAAIEACGDNYAAVAQAFTAQEARNLAGKENDAMRAYMLREFRPVDGYPLAPEQVLLHLQAVKRIYTEGQSAYQFGRPNSLDTLLRHMFDNRNNVWGDGLHSVRIDSIILVGEFDKNSRKIKPVHNTRKFYSRPYNISQAAADHAIPLRLSGARQAMGFDRSALSEGKITPAQLLHNIATYNDPGCPESARAYLFQLVVKLAESMDPYSSGLAFSRSMRQDIADFKTLEAKYTLYSGVWLDVHNIRQDDDIKAFFDKIATHDYCAEILSSVTKITDCCCTYAGYIDANGQVARCHEGEEQLYLMKDGTVTPYTGTAERPYTPLFIETFAQK